MNGGLLHYWRKRANALACETTTMQAPLFIPVAVAEASDAAAGETVTESASRRPMIEIETAGARVRVPEGVDAKTLSVVLAALRCAS